MHAKSSHRIKRVPLFKEHSLSASAVWRISDILQGFFSLLLSMKINHCRFFKKKSARVFISCNPFGYLPALAEGRRVPEMNPNWRRCDVTPTFSSCFSSLTLKAASWWKPGLEMLIRQLHCDANSQERSSCPLIASTGEALVKHQYEVYPGRMPANQHSWFWGLDCEVWVLKV